MSNAIFDERSVVEDQMSGSLSRSGDLTRPNDRIAEESTELLRSGIGPPLADPGDGAFTGNGGRVESTAATNETAKISQSRGSYGGLDDGDPAGRRGTRILVSIHDRLVDVRRTEPR